MKDYIEAHYPEEDCTYDQLRQVVKEAWDSITAEQLRELIDNMRQRCQDVIDANGGHTKWLNENSKWGVSPVQATRERFFRLILWYSDKRMSRGPGGLIRYIFPKLKTWRIRSDKPLPNIPALIV